MSRGVLTYIDRDTGEERQLVLPGYSIGHELDPNNPDDAAALAKDAVGFTDPNLHRRTDPKMHPDPNIEDDEEIDARQYNFTISSVNSYRTTRMTVHDEDSETSEVP